MTRRKHHTSNKPAKPFLKQPPSITGWRLGVFRAITVTVMPVVFLLLLEGVLHISGFGFSSNAFIATNVNGETHFHENFKFGWRFFPPRIARSFEPFVCADDTPEDQVRIVVLGASAAQGVPDSAYGFARILEVMLDQALTPKNAEVIVAAMPAINSHVVLEIAKDCTVLKPDAFLIYLGNNEVVGPYGAGTVFAPLSGNLPLIRSNMALKGTRIGQLITKISSKLAPQNVPTVWKGLSMFADKKVRAESAELQIVYSHFQKNLEDILTATRQTGAKVLLCTVGSNLRDCAPFASLHKTGLGEDQLAQWQSLFDAALSQQQGGQYQQAIDLYIQAMDIDNGYGDLHFCLAQCYDALDDPARALPHYTRARDLDALRIRADSRINEILRKTAQDQSQAGVHLVDTEKALARHAAQGITNETQFLEHVHMTFQGNYRVAHSLFSHLVPLLAHTNTVPAPLTVDECKARLAYTPWNHARLETDVVADFLKKPPFTNQINNAQQVAQREHRLTAINNQDKTLLLKMAKKMFEQAIAKRPNDMPLRWKFARLLDEDLHLRALALRHYVRITKQWPHFSEVYAKQAEALQNLGQLNKAITLNKKALELSPYNPFTYYNLGLAYHRKHDKETAMVNYAKALALKPDFKQALNNTGAIYIENGKYDDAIKLFEEGLKILPNDFNLHYNLGVVYRQTGRFKEARTEFEQALSQNPQSQKPQQALSNIADRL